jgi:predicted lysophospholipase L1 biosynthesis ABC-type transport system permease subunit
MNQSNGSLRNQLRWVHILASIALGAFIYSPWRNSSIFLIVMGAAVFPILALTGVWMWQAPRINRWLKTRQNPSQTAEMQEQDS